MSMQSVGMYNNRIIAQSVVSSHKKQETKEQAVAPKEKNSLFHEQKFLLGAAAIASIAIAGILIARGRKSGAGIVENVNNKPPVQTAKPKNEEVYVSGMKLEFDPVVREAEDDLRKKISTFFKAFRDGKETPQESFKSQIGLYNTSRCDFNTYLGFRIKNVMLLSDKKIPADLREMSPEDVDAVIEFMKNYDKYNIPLRNGENLSNVEVVKRLNGLIDEAIPLEEDVYVLRGVRTKDLFGNHKALSFVEDDLDVGDTIIDKGFVSTSRVYDTELASVDPLLLAEPLRNSGYIMRIRVPKGTKGLDCRRLAQVESDKGQNSTFILPADSEFKITGWDFPRRILDCDYILPE